MAYTQNSSNTSTNNKPAGSNGKGVNVITKNGVAHLFSDTNTISMEALSELKSMGYCRESGSTMNLEDKCNEAMNAMGYTLVTKEELSPGLQGTLKSFSLLGQNNVDETIENSKIIDPDLNKLTPAKINSDDKFKDAADSFYVLDEERSESQKTLLEKDKKKSKKSIIKVTRRLTKEVRISQNKMLLKNAVRTIGQ